MVNTEILSTFMKSFLLECNNLFLSLAMRKIEKVPRGIRGEKSSKDMASSRNLVSTIGAQATPIMGGGGRNQVSGRISVPCWHATPVAVTPIVDKILP